jgi:predicted RNase H-like HicB family nuclease
MSHARINFVTRQFNVIVERDASGLYVATVPAIPGCHTQAASLDELMDRTREAIELCLEQEEKPAEQLDFVGVQTLTVGE